MSCIEAYGKRGWRWVRRGVGGLRGAGVGLGEIMRMMCSALPVSVLVRYGGAYRTILEVGFRFWVYAQGDFLVRWFALPNLR